jgi:hypothetical protein
VLGEVQEENSTLKEKLAQQPPDAQSAAMMIDSNTVEVLKMQVKSLKGRVNDCLDQIAETDQKLESALEEKEEQETLAEHAMAELRRIRREDSTQRKFGISFCYDDESRGRTIAPFLFVTRRAVKEDSEMNFEVGGPFFFLPCLVFSVFFHRRLPMSRRSRNTAARSTSTTILWTPAIRRIWSSSQRYFGFLTPTAFFFLCVCPGEEKGQEGKRRVSQSPKGRDWRYAACSHDPG